MAKKKDEPARAYCNKCGQRTNHDVLASKHVYDEEEIDLSDGTVHRASVTSFEMLVCCGCDNVTLRETYYEHGWGEYEHVTYYPPLVSRKLPPWHKDLPDEIRSLLDETYTALHADSCQLAMMGARALIDLTLVAKVGDSGTFKSRLDALVEKGYTSSGNVQILDIALEAGHAATHRGYVAEPDVVNNVIDIVENLLQAVHVLGAVAERLKKEMPRRPRKKKKSSR